MVVLKLFSNKAISIPRDISIPRESGPPSIPDNKTVEMCLKIVAEWQLEKCKIMSKHREKKVLHVLNSETNSIV